MNKTKPETQGQYIARLRRNDGLTQAQLGEAIGVSRQRVSRIEDGSPLTLAEAAAITGLLDGCDMARLARLPLRIH